MTIKIGSAYGKTFDLSDASEVSVIEKDNLLLISIKKGDDVFDYCISAPHAVIKLDKEK